MKLSLRKPSQTTAPPSHLRAIRVWLDERPLLVKGALALLSVVVLFAFGQSAPASARMATDADVAAPPLAAALPVQNLAALGTEVLLDAGSMATPYASALAPTSAPSPASGPASEASPVCLNEATAIDLRRLPGIGAKRADSILAIRNKLGKLRSIDDLLRVRGIGRKTLQRLRPMLRLSCADAG